MTSPISPVSPYRGAEPVCWVVGAGEFSAKNFSPRAGDLIIAADGGLSALKSLGCEPNLIIGDFDSLGRVPSGENVVAYPPEKDDTDTMLAVKEGIARGFARFELFGGLGGRVAHTLANVQTLAYIAQNGAVGALRGESDIIAIKDAALGFDEDESGYVSVFCLGETATGVTLRGLRYELEDAALTASFPLGVSNRFIGERATISVRSGTLVVVWKSKG